MRIIIADDHAVVRRGLKEILASEHDMDVVGEAKDGDEALELVRKLDINGSRGKGTQVTVSLPLRSK